MINSFSIRYVPVLGWQVILFMRDESFRLCRRHFTKANKALLYGERLKVKCAEKDCGDCWL